MDCIIDTQAYHPLSFVPHPIHWSGVWGLGLDLELLCVLPSIRRAL